MKKIYFVLFAILCTIVFSCTDNLISDDLSSSQNSGVGQVKVFVKQSRLIGPDVSEVSWNVVLQKSGENNTISGKNENGYYLFSGLSDGTYIITVYGKIDEVEKFTGSAKVTITNGNSVSVNVPIVATKNPNAEVQSTGYATITMEMSEELLCLLNFMGEEACLEAKLSMSREGRDANITAYLVKQNLDDLYNIDSIEFLDNQKVEFVDNSSSSPEINENPIPTGYYYLTFFGLDSFTIKLKDNLVEIGDGLTTNIVLTENDYEIVRDYSTVLYVNENGASDNATGSSLSDPIAFSKITENYYADLIYLLSDVDFVYDTDTKNLYPNLGSFFGTISSFDSTVRTISANISNYFNSITLDYVTTLKNIKLSGSNAFSFESLNIDETVILDCNLDAYKPVVCLSKSSNLVVGKNFSGDLYVSLFGDWKLGDTVINFENGKPENSNFYIDSECGNSSGQNYSSMFYIDDSGKLAKYTDDFTSFAWNSGEPCLITQTQAKNKTYTSIYDSSTDIYLNGFNGISTYDEKNQTWYFICNEESGSLILYSVTLTDKYTNSVEATPVFIGTVQFDIQAMAYDNGKLYFVTKGNSGYGFRFWDFTSDDSTLITESFSFQIENATISEITAFSVKGNDFYIATTLTDTIQQNVSTTHSAIWKYELKMEGTANGTFYNLFPVQTYQGDDYPVPYYLTHSDIELTVNGSLPEGSTFRITDLYSDGNSVYGLLANYEDKVQLQSSHSDIHMRGSVFKLTTNSSRQENSDPIMNANHLGLRKSFPLTSVNLATAKKYFILPRKIVGILNKKLVIVDDGMVPDSNDCNVDRFALFDLFNLADEISETIDVAVTFSTNGVANTSESRFYTSNSLFN